VARRGADMVLNAVHVVDVRTGTIARDRMIVVSDGSIVDIAPAIEARPALQNDAIWIDGGGRYAIPGLWDAHAHIISEDTDLALFQLRPLFLAHGVTHVRDMGSTLEARVRYLDASRTMAGPHILSSGPQIWGYDAPWGGQIRLVMETTDAAAGLVNTLADAGVDHIKVYDGLDDVRLQALNAAARARGLSLTGHQQDGHTLERSAALGLRLVEHLVFSALEGCGPDSVEYIRRLVGIRFAGAQGRSIPELYIEFESRIDDDICRPMLERAAANGAVLTPTLAVTYLTPADLETFSPAWTAWLERYGYSYGCALHRNQFDGVPADLIGAFAQSGPAMARRFAEAGVPLLAGTDAPAGCAAPGVSMAAELSLLAQAGLTPLEALQAATVRPASVFGLGSRYGALERGFAADIVLLDADPLASVAAVREVSGVLNQGRWFERDDLARMIAEALAYTSPQAPMGG
jgi:hypothetical protein